MATTPRFWPVWSIRRTSRARISSFIRGPAGSRSGAALMGRRMLHSPSAVAHGPNGGDRRRIEQTAHLQTKPRIGKIGTQVKIVAGVDPRQALPVQAPLESAARGLCPTAG